MSEKRGVQNQFSLKTGLFEKKGWKKGFGKHKCPTPKGKGSEENVKSLEKKNVEGI